MPIRLADSELEGLFAGDKLPRYFWKQSFLYFLMILVNFLVALFSLRLSSGVLWGFHTLLSLRFYVILFNM